MLKTCIHKCCRTNANAKCWVKSWCWTQKEGKWIQKENIFYVLHNGMCMNVCLRVLAMQSSNVDEMAAFSSSFSWSSWWGFFLSVIWCMYVYVYVYYVECVHTHWRRLFFSSLVMRWCTRNETLWTHEMFWFFSSNDSTCPAHVLLSSYNK